MIRIYLENIESDNEIEIFDDQFHYLKNVLRVKQNDFIIIFNETIELECKIIIIQKKYCLAKVVNNKNRIEMLPNINLLQCIIKGDKMNEVCNNAVQFGVKEITPIISQNCYVKDVNFNRMDNAMHAALQQSGGMVKTKINNTINISEIKNIVTQNDLLIYGDLSNEEMGVNEVLEYTKINDIQKIFVLIGPEGGLTNTETNNLQSISNYFGIKIGSRILRAENAATAMLVMANLIIKKIF